MVGCWKRGSSWGPGWKQPQHWGGQSAEEGRRREEQVVNGRAGGAAGRGPGDPGLAPGVGNPMSREGQRGRVGLGETLRGPRWGPCVRSGPRARRKVLQRSKKREEAGRRLRPRWTAGHSPDASLAAHAGGRKAVSDPQGCGSCGRGSASPTCGLLGDPGLRAVGPPGEAPPPAVASVSPEDAQSPVAGRGGFRGAYATPGLLCRARGPERGFEAQLCRVAPGPGSGLGAGGQSSPSWPPGAQPGLITSHPPSLAPRGPGGLGDRGRGGL